MKNTGSVYAEALLGDWDRTAGRMWQIVPKEMLDRLEHPVTREAEDALRKGATNAAE